MSNLDTLSQLLEEPRRQSLKEDLAEFARAAVGRQSGIAGMAVKAAFNAATRLNPAIVERGIDKLLPSVLGEFEPYWKDHPSGTSFADFVAPHAPELSQSLLQVFDAQANTLSNPTLANTYRSLRKRAEKLIAPEIPALSRLLDRHMQG